MGKIQANIGGSIVNIKKVQANIGGVITNIKKIQANIGGVIQTIWTSALSFIQGAEYSIGDNSGNFADIVPINDTKALSLHYENSTYGFLTALTIDPLTKAITKGSKYQCGVGNQFGGLMGAIIDPGKACIVYEYLNDLYVRVATINPNDTFAFSQQWAILYADTVSPKLCNIIALDSTRVLVTYIYNTYLYGVIITINGTIATIGTSTVLFSSYTPSYSDACLISADKVVLTITSSGNDVFARAIEISGNSFTTVGTVYNVNTADRCFDAALVTSVDVDKFVCVYWYMNVSQVMHVRGFVGTVSGTDVAKGTELELLTGTTVELGSVSLCSLQHKDGRLFFSYHDYIPGSTVDAAEQLRGLQVNGTLLSAEPTIWSTGVANGYWAMKIINASSGIYPYSNGGTVPIVARYFTM